MPRARQPGDVRMLNELSYSIRVRRAELGIKQYELAERAGFSAQYIAQIEGGQVPLLPVVTLARICAVLGKTPDELLGYGSAPVEMAG